MNRLISALQLLVLCESFAPQYIISVASRRLRSNDALFAAATLPEGLTKVIQTPGTGLPVAFGDICTVAYSCYVVDDAGGIPISKSKAQKYMIGDGTMIDAWEKALPTMRVGERSIIRVNDPNLAYGSSGVPPIVPANAVIELDLQLLDAQEATTNIDFDSLALADKTPTTAAEIQAAFDKKMAARSDEPQLEGFALFLEKAKSFYFFGLFEGETGERPPWFLRPSITFPLAFAVVGAAFYVSYAGGAISERGAQIKDELDEVILSMNGIDNNAGLAVLAVTAFLVANPSHFF